MSPKSGSAVLTALALTLSFGVSAACAAARQATATIQTTALESVSLRVHSLKELRLMRAFRRTWHQQYDFSCGSAALATLLTFHYDQPINETAVFKAMFAVGDQPQIRAKGFSMLDMKRFLEANGYLADGVQAPMDTLAKVGIPAIALIGDRGYRHFVVLKGVDGDRVLIGDPALGARVMSRRDFEAARVGNLFFVIRNHRERAHFNSPEDWGIRLTAPLSTAIDRDGMGLEILTIPDASHF
jgi:predicted double-glycine peptidase